MPSEITTQAYGPNIDSDSTWDLTTFVLTSYAITWVLLGPWFYLFNSVWKRHLPLWAWLIVPFAFLGGYGPSIAAVLITARTQGRAGVKALLKSLTIWRSSAGWYFFVLLAPLALTALAAVVSPFGPVVRHTFSVPGCLASVPSALLLALPFGPLGEELGWRGYALPRLLKKRGIWAASIILGAIWTFWHIPMIALMPGAALPAFMPVTPRSVVLYLVQITAIGGIMTVVYWVTRGSVLLTLILHLTFNTSDSIFFSCLGDVPPRQLQKIYVLNVMLLAALAIVMLGWLQGRTSKPGPG